MNEIVIEALGVLLGALVAVLGPALVVLALRGARYLTSKADLALTEKQEQQIRWAVETGVAAAEEMGRTYLASHVFKGAAKEDHAKKTARILAPAAVNRLDEEQLGEVVRAAVARMRTSLVPAAPKTPAYPDDERAP